MLANNDVPVRFVYSEGVGHIRLDRPEVANAINGPFIEALAAAIDKCEIDEVKTVVITGAGERFCGGGDIDSFVRSEDPSAFIGNLASSAETQLRRLSELAKPIVAGVKGAVAGAGLAFILNADVVIAGRSTVFTLAFSRIGLTPDSGVSYLLPRVVGLRRALDLAVRERILTADEALEWQLVTEVADDANVDSLAFDLACDIARGNAEAIGQARRLIRSSLHATRSDHADDEVATIAAAVLTSTAQIRLQHFRTRSRR